MSKENNSSWSKKERRILHLFAVLGLVNLLAYFITQNSFIMQNIYWLYGIVTAIDVISLLSGLGMWGERRYKSLKMPRRYKSFLVATGLWLISLPVVAIQYYYPVVNLMDIANVFWSVSLVVSGVYDTMYVMVIVGCWIEKDIEFN